MTLRKGQGEAAFTKRASEVMDVLFREESREQMNLVEDYVETVLEKAPEGWEEKFGGESEKPLTPEEVAKSEIEDKLEEIVIPVVEFGAAPLSGALANLQRQSVEHDAQGEGGTSRCCWWR